MSLRLPLVLLAATITGFFSCSKSEKTLTKERYSHIQEGFITPQDTNAVWCYYYWIGDDISKEGVTKDLEAMKEFGIDGVFIGNINPDEVDGPVPLFSDKWWEITIHAVNEGKRLGVDIGFFNSPGWSQSGGPWIDPDKAMRHLVYSETKINNTGYAEVTLERPAEEFQDSYVLGFRTISAENRRITRKNTVVRTEPSIPNPSNLIDENTSSEALFDIDEYNEYKVEFKSDTSINARSILLYPGQSEFKCECTLFASINGEYRKIKSFFFDRSNLAVAVGPVTKGPVTISLPGVQSDGFKLLFSNIESSHSKVGFSEINISEAAYLQEYVEKSMGKMDPTPFPNFESYMWEKQSEIENKNLIISEVIELSDKMNEEGLLKWNVPKGNWTVLRMGMTPTGTKNAPAAPQGKGYEVDKTNEEYIRYHFDQFIGEIIEKTPENSLSALKYVIADSYETGPQNWTDGFRERFEEKYDYDPMKYLPVISGRIVGSVEESDRFLWDLRRAMADDIAYKYVGGLSEISNEHNLKLWLENYGHWGFPSEFLMYGGQSDLLGGEFWNEGELGNIECKSASSAAHMYGKPVVSAESYTAAGETFKRHPAVLKKRGDWSFTEGINHVVLHVYIHQPDDQRVPGINAWFGTEFNRHNTWFKQGKYWADYLRRSQHLLQQGKYVADVCYFIGEDAPKMTGKTDPELPRGYSYDYINAEVIKERLSVENGKFVLPDGMTFSLLVLPDLNTMRPELLSKIEQLVRDGGTILGAKPEQSPSLENYPHADKAVKELASQLWPDDYSNGNLFNSYGKGHVIDGVGIQEALDFIEVPKDIAINEDLPVLWTHRSLPGMDIYFLTNQGEEEITLNPSFRVEGLKPQLWDAVNGEIRNLNEYTIKDGRIRVPLKMNPLESMFLVFTNVENEYTAKGYDENFPSSQELMEVDGPWEVEFENKEIGPEELQKWKALKDWTAFDDDKIRYYSGTALYKTSFNVEELPENHELFLDLGEVGVMATVKLNGENLGGVWISPFVLPITGYLRKGKNEIEIEVVNTWRNRMIKDESIPEGERYTWTVVNDVDPDEELTTSGLLGPVSVKMVNQKVD